MTVTAVTMSRNAGRSVFARLRVSPLFGGRARPFDDNRGLLKEWAQGRACLRCGFSVARVLFSRRAIAIVHEDPDACPLSRLPRPSHR